MAQSPGRITAGIGSLGSPIGSDIGGTNRNRFISGGQKVRILTIDGGGIFGILAVENLIALEEIIREETGDDNAALSDYIDFVVGSSIGGIIATSILMPSDPEDPMSPPRYSVRQVGDILYADANAAFEQSKRGNWFTNFFLTPARYLCGNVTKLTSEGMNGLLDKFGMNITEYDNLRKPCLIPSYDLKAHEPIFFHSSGVFRAGLETIKNRPFVPKQLSVKDVCKATSAAPTFFPPFIKDMVDTYPGPNGKTLTRRVVCVDGGVVSVSPILPAISEVLAMERSHDDGVTWKDIQPHDVICVSVASNYLQGKPETFGDPENTENWSILQWLRTSLEIYNQGQIGLQRFLLSSIVGVEKSSNVIYKFFRVDTPTELQIENDVISRDFSDARKIVVESLKKLGKEAAASNRSYLREIARELIRWDENIGEPAVLLRRKVRQGADAEDLLSTDVSNVAEEVNKIVVSESNRRQPK